MEDFPELNREWLSSLEELDKATTCNITEPDTCEECGS